VRNGEAVVSARNLRVLKLAVRHDKLLPGLHTHPDKGDQHIILRYMNLGLSDDEPLAGPPFLVMPLVPTMVEATLHAIHRLLILAKGKLLQVVVGLEKHITHGGVHQPLRLEPLSLHGVLAMRVDGIEREQRLPAVPASDLERD